MYFATMVDTENMGAEVARRKN